MNFYFDSIYNNQIQNFAQYTAEWHLIFYFAFVSLTWFFLVSRNMWYIDLICVSDNLAYQSTIISRLFSAPQTISVYYPTMMKQYNPTFCIFMIVCTIYLRLSCAGTQASVISCAVYLIGCSIDIMGFNSVLVNFFWRKVKYSIKRRCF